MIAFFSAPSTAQITRKIIEAAVNAQRAVTDKSISSFSATDLLVSW
jgi:hypothetical protein